MVSSARKGEDTRQVKIGCAILSTPVVEWIAKDRYEGCGVMARTKDNDTTDRALCSKALEADALVVSVCSSVEEVFCAYTCPRSGSI